MWKVRLREREMNLRDERVDDIVIARGRVGGYSSISLVNSHALIKRKCFQPGTGYSGGGGRIKIACS